MYSRDRIKELAEKAADDCKERDACPFDLESSMGELWLDYYYRRIMWLSGELST